jgi:hypothetical protein
MMPMRVELDFRKPRRRFSLLGLFILLCGLTVAYVTLNDYQAQMIESELVETSLVRFSARDRVQNEQAASINPAEVSFATSQLSTPWSALLDDLEAAAMDTSEDVALLEIAPDREKKTVRISGESRTLESALSYLGRLQDAQSVAFPLLEEHEIRTSSRERPVHFVIVAHWRLM